MTGKLRWGILSTAKINDALITPINKSERSELVAVASRNNDKAQSYAREKGIPRAYGSYEALLAAPDVDAVYISLPNTLHAEWAIKAAQAGKHVLCEKPLVPTLAELDQVEKAAADNGVTVFEAFMYLHHPQTRQVKEMIQAGRLGELQLINSWFAYYLPAEQRHNIRLNPALAGGSLWDVGVYPNSMAIFMTGAGAPIEVWASQTLGETGVDVVTAAQMKFANGVVAQITCGFRSPFREGVHIVGEKGVVQIPEPWKPNLFGQDSRVYLFTEESSAPETMVYQIENNDPYLHEVKTMEACVLDGGEPVVTLDLSRNFLRSVLAMFESAKSGRPVKL